MKLGNIFKKVINEATGHSYGCVMLYLEVPTDWWKSITDEIESDDVYDPEGDRSYGVQPASNSHVTILYGLHSDIPDSDVEELIDKMTAPEVTLKKITTFPETNDRGFDVVKFDVTGEDLFKMNKMFAELPHTTDYPDYHPHCTIAYVKTGTGDKYKRTLSDEDSLTIKPTKVVYSKANGEEKEYKFK